MDSCPRLGSTITGSKSSAVINKERVSSEAIRRPRIRIVIFSRGIQRFNPAPESKFGEVGFVATPRGAGGDLAKRVARRQSFELIGNCAIDVEGLGDSSLWR